MRLTQPYISDPLRESLLTAQGDLIKRGAALVERFGIGSANDVLRVNSGGTDLTYDDEVKTLTSNGDILTYWSGALKKLESSGSSQKYLNDQISGALVWDYIKYIYAYGQANTLGIYIEDIGDWDMDTNGGVSVYSSYGGPKFILGVFIRTDSQTIIIPLNYASSYNYVSGAFYYDDVYDRYELTRFAGLLFDSSSYSATSYNRGWIVSIRANSVS